MSGHIDPVCAGEGAKAWAEGLPESACPHTLDERVSWVWGWRNADLGHKIKRWTEFRGINEVGRVKGGEII